MDPPPQAEPTITEDTIEMSRTPIHEDHDEKYGVPTLDELGFDTEGLKPAVWVGGETEALGKKLQHPRLTFSITFQTSSPPRTSPGA